MQLFYEKIRIGSNVPFAEFWHLKRIINGGELHDHHLHADFSLTKIKEKRRIIYDKKLLIMLCCFFAFNANAEIKNNSIKSKLILESGNYKGDEIISKKEIAKKLDLSCTVAHPYGGIEKKNVYFLR